MTKRERNVKPNDEVEVEVILQGENQKGQKIIVFEELATRGLSIIEALNHKDVDWLLQNIPNIKTSHNEGIILPGKSDKNLIFFWSMVALALHDIKIYQGLQPKWEHEIEVFLRSDRIRLDKEREKLLGKMTAIFKQAQLLENKAELNTTGHIESASGSNEGPGPGKPEEPDGTAHYPVESSSQNVPQSGFSSAQAGSELLQRILTREALPEDQTVIEAMKNGGTNVHSALRAQSRAWLIQGPPDNQNKYFNEEYPVEKPITDYSIATWMSYLALQDLAINRASRKNWIEEFEVFLMEKRRKKKWPRDMGDDRRREFLAIARQQLGDPGQPIPKSNSTRIYNLRSHQYADINRSLGLQDFTFQRRNKTRTLSAKKLRTKRNRLPKPALNLARRPDKALNSTRIYNLRSHQQKSTFQCKLGAGKNFREPRTKRGRSLEPAVKLARRPDEALNSTRIYNLRSRQPKFTFRCSLGIGKDSREPRTKRGRSPEPAVKLAKSPEKGGPEGRPTKKRKKKVQDQKEVCDHDDSVTSPKQNEWKDCEDTAPVSGPLQPTIDVSTAQYLPGYSTLLTPEDNPNSALPTTNESNAFSLDKIKDYGPSTEQTSSSHLIDFQPTPTPEAPGREDFRDLESKLAAKDSQVKELQDKIASTERMLHERGALQAVVGQLQAELDTAQQASSKAKQTMTDEFTSDFQKQHEKHQLALEELKALHSKEQADRDSAFATKYEATIKKFQVSSDQRDANDEKLRRKNCNLVNDLNKRLEESIGVREAAEGFWKQQIAESAQEISKLTGLNEEFTKEIERLQAMKEKSEEALKVTQNDLAGVQKEIKELQDQIASIDLIERAEPTNNIKELYNKIALEEYETTITDLNLQIKEAAEKATALIIKHNQQQSESTSAREALQASFEQQYENQRAVYVDRISNLEKELEKCKSNQERLSLTQAEYEVSLNKLEGLDFKIKEDKMALEAAQRDLTAVQQKKKLEIDACKREAKIKEGLHKKAMLDLEKKMSETISLIQKEHLELCATYINEIEDLKAKLRIPPIVDEASEWSNTAIGQQDDEKLLIETDWEEECQIYKLKEKISNLKIAHEELAKNYKLLVLEHEVQKNECQAHLNAQTELEARLRNSQKQLEVLSLEHEVQENECQAHLNARTELEARLRNGQKQLEVLTLEHEVQKNECQAHLNAQTDLEAQLKDCQRQHKILKTQNGQFNNQINKQNTLYQPAQGAFEAHGQKSITKQTEHQEVRKKGVESRQGINAHLAKFQNKEHEQPNAKRNEKFPGYQAFEGKPYRSLAYSPPKFHSWLENYFDPRYDPSTNLYSILINGNERILERGDFSQSHTGTFLYKDRDTNKLFWTDVLDDVDERFVFLEDKGDKTYAIKPDGSQFLFRRELWWRDGRLAKAFQEIGETLVCRERTARYWAFAGPGGLVKGNRWKAIKQSQQDKNNCYYAENDTQRRVEEELVLKSVWRPGFVPTANKTNEEKGGIWADFKACYIYFLKAELYLELFPASRSLTTTPLRSPLKTKEAPHGQDLNTFLLQQVSIVMHMLKKREETENGSMPIGAPKSKAKETNNGAILISASTKLQEAQEQGDTARKNYNEVYHCQSPAQSSTHLPLSTSPTTGDIKLKVSTNLLVANLGHEPISPPSPGSSSSYESARSIAQIYCPPLPSADPISPVILNAQPCVTPQILVPMKDDATQTERLARAAKNSRCDKKEIVSVTARKKGGLGKHRKRHRWNEVDEASLIRLIGKYGTQWSKIARQPVVWDNRRALSGLQIQSNNNKDDMQLKETKFQGQLKDKARNLRRKFQRYGDPLPLNFDGVSF